MLRCLFCLFLLPAVAFAAEAGSPFKRRPSKWPREGTIVLSSGEKLVGRITTTTGKPWRVFDRPGNRYIDVHFPDVQRVDVTVEKNVTERVWRWKEGGSDVKVYTDKYYIWHKYITTVRLRDGTVVEGDLQARVYVKTKGKKRRLDLHKRHKGQIATKDKLAAPVYIKEIVFGEPPQPAKEDD